MLRCTGPQAGLRPRPCLHPNERHRRPCTHTHRHSHAAILHSASPVWLGSSNTQHTNARLPLLRCSRVHALKRPSWVRACVLLACIHPCTQPHIRTAHRTLNNLGLHTRTCEWPLATRLWHNTTTNTCNNTQHTHTHRAAPTPPARAAVRRMTATTGSRT